jgi:hypothetical protein
MELLLGWICLKFHLLQAIGTVFVTVTAPDECFSFLFSNAKKVRYGCVLQAVTFIKCFYNYSTIHRVQFGAVPCYFKRSYVDYTAR